MQLRTARQAWHDAYYTPWDSVMAHCMTMAKLGTDIQRTEGDRSTAQAWHQVIAGKVQAAIKTLPYPLQAFGHALYAPQAMDEEREIAESMVYGYAGSQMGRMTTKKAEKALYVAAGVFFRYRHMVQGGQDGSRDPLPSSERFITWLYNEYGVEIKNDHWGRDWADYIQHCFRACNDFDRDALAPVAKMIGQMKIAA